LFGDLLVAFCKRTACCLNSIVSRRKSPKHESHKDLDVKRSLILFIISNLHKVFIWLEAEKNFCTNQTNTK